MPSKHPSYLFTVGMKVFCARPSSEYYKQQGTVVDHHVENAHDVRVVVRWDRTGDTCRYRRSSLAQAPFTVKGHPPSVGQSETPTHKVKTKTYRLPPAVQGAAQLNRIRATHL